MSAEMYAMAAPTFMPAAKMPFDACSPHEKYQQHYHYRRRLASHEPEARPVLYIFVMPLDGCCQVDDGHRMKSGSSAQARRRQYWPSPCASRWVGDGGNTSRGHAGTACAASDASTYAKSYYATNAVASAMPMALEMLGMKSNVGPHRRASMT